MNTTAAALSNDQLEALLTADGLTLVERLDHWARARPDAVCIYDGETDAEYTYHHFGRLTDGYAGSLAALGVQQGDRVSVFTTNSLLSATMMFACWKAGAVYSPVNFSYQGRLLSYQLNDTGPVLVVTDAGLAGRLVEVENTVEPDYAAIVFEHEDHGAVTGAGRTVLPWSQLDAAALRPAVEVRPDDPANIVYTSGTTGPAKGVLQPHRWINQYTYGLRALLAEDDVVYNDLPMYHVGGAFANVGRAIWAGCEAAIWNRFSASEFWDRIERRGASAAILLDVMIPWLMKAPESPRDRQNSLNKVHMQPLPLQHTAVARRFGIDYVTAGFGQTESGAPLKLLMVECPEGTGTPAHLRTGMAHDTVLQAAEARHLTVVDGETITEKGAMGYPAPFAEVSILGPDDHPVQAGTPGELGVRPRLPGIMMTEYIGKPEATEKAWRGGRFHTGDSAIQDADGSFRFVDRMGDRIRVRGENLSSFQVEDLMNGHSAVQLTAVFAVPSDEGDEDDIIAYVVAQDGATLTIDELHSYAETAMPKYMRPKHIRIVDDIPRTPTNKIEKYKLRQQFNES